LGGDFVDALGVRDGFLDGGLRERVLQRHEFLHVLGAEQGAGIGDRVLECALHGAGIDVRQLLERGELGIRYGEERFDVGLLRRLDLFRGHVHLLAPSYVYWVCCIAAMTILGQRGTKSSTLYVAPIATAKSRKVRRPFETAS